MNDCYVQRELNTMDVESETALEKILITEQTIPIAYTKTFYNEIHCNPLDNNLSTTNISWNPSRTIV